MDMSALPAARPATVSSPAAGLEFERVYRENVAGISAFFARRATEPEVVADLTSQTFVEAIASAPTYQGRGTPRAWLFAIARATYARHCQAGAEAAGLVQRLAGQMVWEEDERLDVMQRIDAEHDGRELLQRAGRLPAGERAALELVDLAQLTPTEAADALGISSGALRVRLHRARRRLRKEPI
jgi:RNA polymerase sigma factor (sigma-70 family)